MTKAKTYDIINIENEREVKIMTTKVYYIPYDKAIAKVEKIETVVPCFVEVEDVEMGYAAVTIKVRDEDVATIERYFADVV